VKSIDFLPEIYRQRETLRRARLWWGIVVVLFTTVIGASTLAQAWQRRRTQQHLDALTGDYAAAQTQVQELATLQAQILRAGHEASLYTYLENPWPRTQLLAQVVGPLPDCIRLTQIHVTEQESAKTAVQVGPRSTKSDEESATKASGPEKDLARVQEEYDRRQTLIEIDGHSTDVPRLHEYVSAVSRSPVVGGATIKSLEATANQAGTTRFTLRLTIRPGYCQLPSDSPVITPVITPVSLPPVGRPVQGGGG
jgi:Tfp pilus assembly protein PilN